MAVETFVPTASVITVTPTAARHFEQKLGDSKQIIRFATRESGCTGYAYVVDFADAPQADDEVIQVTDKLTVAVARAAVPMLRDTEIDYVKEGINGVLKFNNPNIAEACGCGESFSVKS
ncbi:HesB/IscA family protein [Aliidiomarina indica]|uniref:HesB/IscA family protein n=1 Tax=Aliidiomarina indica TaxID=2749147 RepID=UPI00188EDF22|nr:iron-sulfur cluster assembly accessory protein [Aliidiomarina indica]